MDDAKPAPAGGQPWARELVKQGDKHCRANQKLRLQTQNALKIQRENPFRTPSLFAHRSPGAWLKRDRVPTFLVGQFQDEQTGGHFAESLKYLNGRPDVFISIQNGVHVDSLGPTTITRWAEFLKLYVANEIPVVPDSVLSLSGALYGALAAAPADPVLQSRFAGMTERRRGEGDLQARPARARADGQRRRPAGPRLDRRALGARVQLVAAEGGQGDALLPRPAGRARRQARERVDGRVRRRPQGAPAPDAAGRRGRGRLEGSAALQLGAGRGRQGARLHHAAAGGATS